METVRINNNKVMIPKTGAMNVDAFVYCSPQMKVEESAFRQLMNVASLPSVKYAIATPDIHHGFGAPIGTVLGLKDYICPAAVGYDINCGMRLLTTGMLANDVDVRQLADEVDRYVPLGEGKRGKLELSSGQLRLVLERGMKGLYELRELGGSHFECWDEETFVNDCKNTEDEGSFRASAADISLSAIKRGMPQLGTLGGGNHFIEFQTVNRIESPKEAEILGLKKGHLVVMIHSGSRGFGHEIGGEFMKTAAAMSAGVIPNSELGVLPLDSAEANRYIEAMRCAANFAYCNRTVMANLVRKAFKLHFPDSRLKQVYDVTHNMAKKELHGSTTLWVHRKGATRAFPAERMQHYPHTKIGQPVLIPGSMGTASYVLVGNDAAHENLFSVNHGAGRVLSRSAAVGMNRKGKRVAEPAISDSEFKQSMKGIYLVTPNQRRIKEEAPAAYKDIDLVIETVKGANLAKVVAKMKPLAVLKG